MARSIRDLRDDYDNAAKAVTEAVQASCEAADTATATPSGDASERFGRQEVEAFLAYDNWRKASENLWRALGPSNDP
jgi:hypothetical protein